MRNTALNKWLYRMDWCYAFKMRALFFVETVFKYLGKLEEQECLQNCSGHLPTLGDIPYNDFVYSNSLTKCRGYQEHGKPCINICSPRCPFWVNSSTHNEMSFQKCANGRTILYPSQCAATQTWPTGYVIHFNPLAYKPFDFDQPFYAIKKKDQCLTTIELINAYYDIPADCYCGKRQLTMLTIGLVVSISLCVLFLSVYTLYTYCTWQTNKKNRKITVNSSESTVKSVRWGRWPLRELRVILAKFDDRLFSCFVNCITRAFDDMQYCNFMMTQFIDRGVNNIYCGHFTVVVESSRNRKNARSAGN